MGQMNIPSSSVLLDRNNRINAIKELYRLVAEMGNNDAIANLNNEIYNLKKTVGDLGGSVTFELPNEAGKSFNTLMSNNGTVKLYDDVTTGRYGPGILASNKVTLNLNGHNLTITNAGSNAAIQGRGSQEITISGSGKVDAGQSIAVMSNGADCVINIKGGTFVTDRPGAELIYCYNGTINISGGIFKNGGSPYLLNCYDSSYQSGKARIVVTGGSFYDFDPGNNRAEGEGTSYLADGYISVPSTVVEDGVEHTVYKVKKA